MLMLRINPTRAHVAIALGMTLKALKNKLFLITRKYNVKTLPEVMAQDEALLAQGIDMVQLNRHNNRKERYL